MPLLGTRGAASAKAFGFTSKTAASTVYPSPYALVVLYDYDSSASSATRRFIVTADGGDTWTTAVQEVAGVNVLAQKTYGIHSGNDNYYFVYGGNNVINKVNSLGVNSTLNTTPVSVIDCTPLSGTTVLQATYGSKNVRSTDNGSSWTDTYNPAGLPYGSFKLCTAYGNNILFTGWYDGSGNYQYARSTNNGASWTQVTSVLPSTPSGAWPPKGMSVFNSGTFYFWVATSSGTFTLFTSTDASTWTSVGTTNGMSQSGNIYSNYRPILYSNGYFWALQYGEIYRSSDGLTWSNFLANPFSRTGIGFAATPNGILMLAAYYSSDMLIYKTPYTSPSWTLKASYTPVSSGSPSFSWGYDNDSTACFMYPLNAG